MSERRLSVPPARVPPACTRRAACAPGFALIVALLMLAAIGLASAAIMRNATSADQVTNGSRLHTQASQSAQLGLRFCESQLALAAPARSAALQPAATPGAWTLRGAWAAGGTAHALLPAEIGGAMRPRIPPQCLAEAASLPDLYIVTARGFSADYQADPLTGATRNGAAVWLQATIYAVGAGRSSEAASGALSVRQRVWQQLLTPPF